MPRNRKAGSELRCRSKLIGKTTDISESNKNAPNLVNRSNQSFKDTNSNNTIKQNRRKQCKIVTFNDFVSEFKDCNLDDAIALKDKIRKVADQNNLSHEEILKLLQKFVKNEQILALVTLKAEDSLAKKKDESEQKAIIITDTPSVPKLTRARARELNKTPIIKLPSSTETQKTDIVSLITDELHSDDEDEEYSIHDEYVESDDDTIFTVSDLETGSPLPPINKTSDNCFKVPKDKLETIHKDHDDDLKIAHRTRSKLCLEQTTIEDIEAQFIPPDVDDYLNVLDTDVIINDEEWQQFLNDFMKPCISTDGNINGDDDDFINDPEYEAAEKEYHDPDELNYIDIPQTEINSLMTELADFLDQQSLPNMSLNVDTKSESWQQSALIEQKANLDHGLDNASIPKIDIESNEQPTSQKSWQELHLQNQSDLVTTTSMSENDNIFSSNVESTMESDKETVFNEIPDSINYGNIHSISFDNSTESYALVPIAEATDKGINVTSKLVAVPTIALDKQIKLIAVPQVGDGATASTCYQLAKIIDNNEMNPSNNSIQIDLNESLLGLNKESHALTENGRYNIPYDTNYTWEYISVRKHVVSEYITKYENLRNDQVNQVTSTTSEIESFNKIDKFGFTLYQYYLLQQHLRIHVQILTQTYLQLYSHSELWHMAPKAENMLKELKDKAINNNNFSVWNLDKSLVLIEAWKKKCSENTLETTKMMQFIHKEIELTNRNTRQIPKFAPHIMDFILDSTVFMYPQYLPRMPFNPRIRSYEAFAPSEAYLIALGLEKHLNCIQKSNERVFHKTTPLRLACKRLCGDTIWGKNFRRVWDHIKSLQNANYYNPIKYFFEHNKAPVIYMPIIGFEDNKVLPLKNRITELPLAWKSYMEQKLDSTNNLENSCINSESTNSSKLQVTDRTSQAYEQLVFDVITDINNTDTSASILNNTFNFEALKRKNESPDHNSKRLKTTENSIKLFEIKIDVPVAKSESESENKENISSECLSNIANVPLRVLTLNKPTTKINLSKYHKHYCRLNIRRYRKRIKDHHYYKQIPIRKFCIYLKSYQKYLIKISECYKKSPIIQKYYRYFKALQLYTNLLRDLKMFCQPSTEITSNNITTSSNSPSNLKRPRNTIRDEEDTNPSTNRSARKLMRHEENYRQMLLPDTPDEANRKDALYAFNFYKHVEEILKSSNHPEYCKTFNQILRSFNPKREKVSDLYYRLEQLFLPDHPELAQIFLSFLLPSEAAEIGKFFEHFMVTNITTFINKLNVYFNKQPAQVRKIYNCLSELADDPMLDLKKVEGKILPLLKGNQFLIDWFMQQFIQSVPPERLFSAPENILNLKDCENKNPGNYIETVTDILDSPNNDQPNGNSCQLRYINGRIFYGSKMLLPAKLSFMARSYQDNTLQKTAIMPNLHLTSGCVHGIRDYGEMRLQNASENNFSTIPISTLENNDPNENNKSSEEICKDVVTDISMNEDNSLSTMECSDDILRAHAIRLNPTYYGSTCFNTCSSANTNTSLMTTSNLNLVQHNTNKKLSYNHEDGKTSPHKNFSNQISTSNENDSLVDPTATLAENQINSTIQLSFTREKRKSPCKKNKSPITYTIRTIINQTNDNNTNDSILPMVVIPDNSAIDCAKRLKSFIEQNENLSVNYCKMNLNNSINIVARTKEAVRQISTNVDDDEEKPEKTKNHLLESDESNSIIKINSSLNDSKNDTKTIEEECKETESTSTKSPSSSQIIETPLKTESVEQVKIDNGNPINSNNLESCQSDNKTIENSKESISNIPWTRSEDKILLIEMKMNSKNCTKIYERVKAELPNRTHEEIMERHRFYIEFLTKLQKK